MRARTLALAGLAGIAGLVLVGAAVTELLAAWIEFSLFLGIPAGLLAGGAAAFLVLVRLEDRSATRRRPALAAAGFGVTFVATLLLGTFGVGLPNSIAIPAAAVVGLVGAVAGYRAPKQAASRL